MDQVRRLVNDFARQLDLDSASVEVRRVATPGLFAATREAVFVDQSAEAQVSPVVLANAGGAAGVFGDANYEPVSVRVQLVLEGARRARRGLTLL